MKLADSKNNRGGLQVNQEGRRAGRLTCGVGGAALVICGLMLTALGVFLVLRHETLRREVEGLRKTSAAQQKTLNEILNALKTAGIEVDTPTAEKVNNSEHDAKINRSDSTVNNTENGDYFKYNHAVRHLRTKIRKDANKKKGRRSVSHGGCPCHRHEFILEHVFMKDGRQMFHDLGAVPWDTVKHYGMTLHDGFLLIPETGFYYVYAQMTFNGKRRECNLEIPHYEVKVERQGNTFETLIQAFSSQTKGGCVDLRTGGRSSRVNGGDFPLDTVNVGGVFHFAQWDKIAVFIPRESLNSVFDMRRDRSFFGAFGITNLLHT